MRIKPGKKLKERIAIDIKRLAISNSWKIVETFKKTLSNVPTRPKTFNNAILDFPRSETFYNAILDFSRPNSSSFISKDSFNNNARFSNS